MNKDYIIKSYNLINKLTRKNFIGQNYLDLDCFNELIAKTFKLKRVHLHPTNNRVTPFIGEYTVIIEGIKVYFYLENREMGYLSVGISIGHQGVWINETIRNICRETAN